MTRTELAEAIHGDVETRIREGVKAVIEQILEEEMTTHIRPPRVSARLTGAASAMAIMNVTLSLPWAK